MLPLYDEVIRSALSDTLNVFSRVDATTWQGAGTLVGMLDTWLLRCLLPGPDGGQWTLTAVDADKAFTSIGNGMFEPLYLVFRVDATEIYFTL